MIYENITGASLTLAAGDTVPAGGTAALDRLWPHDAEHVLAGRLRVAQPGVVLLPAGRLACSGLVCTSGLRLLGAPEGTTIVYDGPVGEHAIRGTGSPLADVTIGRLTLDGAGRAAHGIGLPFVDGLTVHDLVIVGATFHALNAASGARVVARRVRASDPGQHGINATGCTDVTVDDCQVSGAVMGIHTTGSSRVDVLRSRVSDCSFIGIAAGSGASGFAAHANRVWDCIDNGIDVGNTDGYDVIGNRISNCGSGIVGDGASDGVVNSNRVTGTTGSDVGALGAGVALVASSPVEGATVVGNLARDLHGAGVLVDGTSGVAVSSNRIERASRKAAGNSSGIRLSSTVVQPAGAAIFGNLIVDRAAPVMHRHGISVAAGWSGYEIGDNRIDGYTVSPIDLPS